MTEQLPQYSVVEDQVFEVLFEAECPSLSGRSQLTFQAARLKDAHGALHIRLAKNTGKGVFCKDWVAVTDVDALLASSQDLSARTFLPLWPGKSINNGGFLLAVLKDLGLVRLASDESRRHVSVPGATLTQALQARIGADKDKKKSRTPQGGE
jgi:hypothetical protein